MSYIACPSCKNLNKLTQHNCYSCNGSLQQAKEREVSATFSNNVTTEASSANSNITAFLGIALSAMLGCAMGFGFSLVEAEMPFFLVEVILGSTCAVVAVYSVAIFQEMPSHQIPRRAIPAALLGAVVGFCLFLVWYAFDPSAGFPAIGAIAGFLSSIPIMVSFGLMGGESRPIGKLEFLNVISGLVVGLLVGFFISDFDIYLAFGFTGAIGLVPLLFGGRINVVELLEAV